MQMVIKHLILKNKEVLKEDKDKINKIIMFYKINRIKQEMQKAITYLSIFKIKKLCKTLYIIITFKMVNLLY